MATARHETNQEYGLDMDQQAMMESDMLITVDTNDVLVDGGTQCSKKQAHTFGTDQPRGVLHRAFSFFLFNQDNKMLLTQRADSKITFPSVWTNTCCSHPLHGMTPNEVDVVPDAYPQFDGIKYAAIRKLKQELGITVDAIPHDQIKFVSRFHYWAADTRTHGPDSPWGEHEVDYILFLKVPEPVVRANPEEVSNSKYVSIQELKDMMATPGLIWSPWFQGIMERGGFAWWEDLDGALDGKHTNEDVTFFDPAPEHIANYNLPSHTRMTGVLSK
jgi:isopentenyl-diphosphate delta-isomerase type 1